MNQTRQTPNFLARLLPFFGMGVLVVIAIVAFIFFSYLIVLGCIIGLILFAVAYIKSKFFPSKKITVYRESNTGTTYDHKRNNS